MCDSELLVPILHPAPQICQIVFGLLRQQEKSHVIEESSILVLVTAKVLEMQIVEHDIACCQGGDGKTIACRSGWP